MTIKLRWIYWLCFVVIYWSVSHQATAGNGHWNIQQLDFGDYGIQPSINNSNEIVWAAEGDFGIYSNVRGKLTDSGLAPKLANSGEVVYAAWFGGPLWDLVSTTRGRLTYNSVIDVNASSFSVNAFGEVVYSAKDTNNDLQIFSTVRGQLTAQAGTHVNPCINDLGEIVWLQYEAESIGLYSTSRGIIPCDYALPVALNNLGEVCYIGYLKDQSGNNTFPHIFSNTYGAVLADPAKMEWDGSMNDAGTIVFRAQWAGPWHFYRAQWVNEDTIPPIILQMHAVQKTVWMGYLPRIEVQLVVDATASIGPAPTSRIISVTEVNRQANQGWNLTGPLTTLFQNRYRNRSFKFVVECRDAQGNTSTNSIVVKLKP